MKLTFVFITLITFSFLQCCNQQNDISSEFIMNNMVYYPNDSISMEFELVIEVEEPPYTVQWNYPDSLEGTGPFTIPIAEDLQLDATIIDAHNQQFEFLHLIQKDTIDPLKYDYRNPYLGFYECKVYLSDYYPRPAGFDTVYMDTLEVSKHDEFTALIVSYETYRDPNHRESVEFNYRLLEFRTYHTRCFFYSEDSIFYSHYWSAGGFPGWGWTGRKIEH